MTSTPLSLSIIIPAHDEERRLPPTLAAIDAFLDGEPYASEVLVVDNGSTDRTASVAAQFARRHPRVRVLSEPVRGKGLAVRRGMLAATGTHRFTCDADLSMPIAGLPAFFGPLERGFDLVIGSREAPGARRFREPRHRRARGRAFTRLARLMRLVREGDSQCGFKCYSAAAARQLFALQRIDGLGFEVELLFLARRLGLRVAEVPIDWYWDADSRVRPLADPLQMVLELLLIRWYAARGRYHPRLPALPQRSTCSLV